MNKLVRMLSLACVFFSSAVFAEWFPFEIKNNHIMIEVEIAGHPAMALLDSGAEMNIISEHFVEQHGKDFNRTGRMKVEGVHGVETYYQYANIPIKLYGAEFTLRNVPAAPVFGAQIVFGAPFFNGAIVQIDYPNKRLQLIDRSAVDLAKLANLEMKRERGS